jgi:uncharacterized repeat protein (TIGR01451 family)
MRRCLILGIVLFILWAPAVEAQSPDGAGTDLFVTLAARYCPAYTDITANRARNDIQESLKDLGADSPYKAGDEIDPGIEAKNQPACSPLPGWSFTLGKGYRSRAVTGPWGALSVVTDPYAGSPVTQAQTPLLDYDGLPTGETLEGAVTIELTPDQAARAAKRNTLWIQGGTVADPILDQEFPGVYGFGALRCAIDDLNGDNVEWISYPSGTDHVFCYAYYVRPPPTSGTIVIRKDVDSPPDANETFAFDGNLSFNGNGIFNLVVKNGKPASATFFRAAGQDWTVRELVPDGWDLTSLVCTAEQEGESSIEVNEKTATATIGLAAGDKVTCTYKDKPRPADGQLFLRKISRDGVGSFGFDVTPVGGGKVRSTTIVTREPDVPVDARDPIKLPPGRYRIDEDLPDGQGGRWKLTEANCNGITRGRKKGSAIEVTIEPGQGQACTFENEFIPAGDLSITKETVGGTGTTSFVISPVRDPEIQYSQTATTKRENDLELGAYVIQETHPYAPDGEWRLASVICNKEVYPAAEGRVKIELTKKVPGFECAFVNRLDLTPKPPDPPGPNPEPGGPLPDLVVNKRADPATTVIGGRVTYTVGVRNRGDATAENVVLIDQIESFERLISAPPGCRGQRQISCALGDILPGAQRTLRFTTEIIARPRGKQKNTAVVVSSSPERTLANSSASAGIRVVRDPCATTAFGRSRGALAQAAC